MRTLALLSPVLLIAGAHAAQAQTIPVWRGVAPGSENWSYREHTYGGTPVGTVITNVVTPTLTAYLPPRDQATGTAVIVAPGGGFVTLAMDRGGRDVAQWFQQRGIAAFVLKYRLMEDRGDWQPYMHPDSAGRYAIADGIRAVKVVREHAEEWGISPNRVGFIGFSAGAMVASAALLQPDSAARPDFVALIYGAPFGAIPPIPDNLPPIFMAWAQDDPEVLHQVEAFYAALRKAGVTPEVHIFSSGGHGFGIQREGTTSDHWMDELSFWLEALQLTVPVTR
jgi:acetyl esterase/lipase